MTQHHPDIHLLTDYSAGNLPFSKALCVAAHLEFCPHCQSDVEKMNTLGSLMVHEAAEASQHAVSEFSENATALSDKLIDSVFNALDNPEPDNTEQRCHGEYAAAKPGKLLPHCLHKLVPDNLEQLDWKKLSASLSIARLAAGDRQREVALHKLRPGGGVANHDHRGTEITVVLRGNFSDQQGLYQPGDFLVREAGQAHQPIASEDMECICLSVLEAPVKFTGPLTRLINPFLKIYPSA